MNRRLAAVLLACAFAVSVVSGQRYSEWSAPDNLGAVVNSAAIDGGAFVTKDGLSLYFVSSRQPGGFGGNDIWVTQRDSLEDPWGVPENLGGAINTAGNDVTPTVSQDGHYLFFASDGRADGLGRGDLYVSYRQHKRDDFGWGPPVSLGPLVNSAANDIGPSLLQGARGTLYFNSNRNGNDDIFVSELREDGQFDLAVVVPELNSPANDLRPAVRRDGLELFLDSDRLGSLGDLDLWVARRASLDDPWSEPENLGPSVNTSGREARPAIGFDRQTLFFQAVRPGGFGAADLYVSTRDKIPSDD